MKYQFEHKEIKHCYECPCWDDVSGCRLDEIPAVCPLVTISKTETASVEVEK